MKWLFTKKKIFIGGSLISLAILTLYLFLDAFYGSNFRSTQDTLWTMQKIDVRGLRELRASGGTSVRFLDLQRRLSHIQGPKIIVDGMAEYHGYIHGIPTNFFAYQRKGSPELKHLIRRWFFTGTTDIRLGLVNSEPMEAKKYGFDYKKVNVGSQFIETEENIDEIVSFFDTLPENVWLHFHCAHGQGRTSILLVMLDTFKNAPLVSINDIVKRQALLGSEDLFNTDVWKGRTYNKQMLEARKKFIEEFYQFVCQRKTGGIQRWSDWVNSKCAHEDITS
ncbi:MAG: hypothetical protein K2W92_00260 [Alphaproteobacteria bacterium]|nr:hypothetical protein [Alphaproteobacteria bacterium]